jgi:GNAT superfamily N-acetyltransferase
MVDPARQRQGVGTRLLSAVLEGLAEDGIALVHAGANALGPFWQGIPVCLPAARAFFEKHGWEVYETSYDLIMHLGSFSVPEWVMARIRDHGTSVGLARPDEAAAVLAFHEAEWPVYREWFAEEIDQRGTRNIVVAREGTTIVGGVSLLFNDPCSPKWTGRQWRCFLGDDMGGLAAPGVAEPKRNRGIGTALVAEASRVLAERGVGNCFVHWTWLVDWYGKLGYRVWQEYWMARKQIAD